MNKLFPLQKSSLEQKLIFERERLLNLILSNVGRNEMDNARELTEKLFRIEKEFVIRRETRRFSRYNSLILGIIIFFTGIFSWSILCAVLNINPLFFLMVEAFTACAIISAIVFNAFLMKRFNGVLSVVHNAFEALEKSFIDGVLENFVKNRGSNRPLNSLLPAIPELRL